MRPLCLAVLLALPAALPAQRAALSSADSALVGRILVGEDRRDSTDAALSEGALHSDARIRVLAQRARGRVVDPAFAARDSLPALPAPPAWPEPSWRLRYRELADRRDDCGALRAALADSEWPVRLRAANLATEACAGDEDLVATLRRWVDALPADASTRTPGSVSWHAAAHGIVALARLRPDEARERLGKLVVHRQWQVRAYAARAAAVISHTAFLRSLARDPDDNVREAAIDALSQLGGHDHDDVYVAALGAEGAQSVRAAARAVKGSPRTDARAAASAAFERLVARDSESERDARIALLEAAGRPASDDRPPVTRVELPPDAVALALGADVRLRVTMAPSAGGGSFVVRLRGDVAPVMSARILGLARAGYYDGLSWQRVEHDFVIQGGSPGASEYIGHARYLRDELGTVPHVRGTVGMSTRGHDTGDAQWFVNLRDNLRLGRSYTVFAEVIDGIEVVDGILEGDIIASIEEVGSSPARPAEQEPAFPALDADAPPGAGIVRACRPQGVRGTARCGVFRVPENRARAGGRHIDIAFVVLDALEPEARLNDAIILLPGGPGQAFTHTAAQQSRRHGDELRRRRDILLVDVRGVGRSAALSCDVPHPGGFASRFGSVFPLDHVMACRDSSSRRAQLDQYTTAAMVDDLEELRRWLGYGSLNLFGTSYGTRVAQVYMRRYPVAVRTAVLNGVAPVAEPLYVQHAFLLQRALERLLAECQADGSCRSAHPDLHDRLARLLARFKDGPVEVDVRGTRAPFGLGDLSYALRGLLYQRGAELPGFIHRGADGDVAPLADYYLDRTDQFSAPDGHAALHFSVLCAEDIAPLTDEMVVSATRGTFMGAHLIDGYRSLCRIWPHAELPASHWTPVRSDVPTLLFSGGRDPVTPPEGGDAVAAHLRRSLHVVIPNGGHGVGGECVRALIAGLVTTGTLDGLTPSCGASAR